MRISAIVTERFGNVTADFGDVTGAGRSVLRVFEL
jgi:hypothetical protein